MPMGGPVPLLPPLRPPLGSTEFWKDSLMSCRTGPTSGTSGRARDGDMLMLLRKGLGWCGGATDDPPPLPPGTGP